MTEPKKEIEKYGPYTVHKMSKSLIFDLIIHTKKLKNKFRGRASRKKENKKKTSKTY